MSKNHGVIEEKSEIEAVGHRVVHGGEATAMNCSNGNCSVTIDYSGYPANVHFDASDINLDSVWVISDKGGSARYENINTR